MLKHFKTELFLSWCSILITKCFLSVWKNFYRNKIWRLGLISSGWIHFTKFQNKILSSRLNIKCGWSFFSKDFVENTQPCIPVSRLLRGVSYPYSCVKHFLTPNLQHLTWKFFLSGRNQMNLFFFLHPQEKTFFFEKDRLL